MNVCQKSEKVWEGLKQIGPSLLTACDSFVLFFFIHLQYYSFVSHSDFILFRNLNTALACALL